MSLLPDFRVLHRMVTTSITQTEKIYYHIDTDMMREAAMADHYMEKDGIVVRAKVW